MKEVLRLELAIPKIIYTTKVIDENKITFEALGISTKEEEGFMYKLYTPEISKNGNYNANIFLSKGELSQIIVKKFKVEGFEANRKLKKGKM